MSYLVHVTVEEDSGSANCSNTIQCDGESTCSTSIRSIGCGEYIDPCDSVIVEVMAVGNPDYTESLSSNIAPYLSTSDWNLENSSTITFSILTARWGPPDDYSSSDVKCANKTLVTSTCSDQNDADVQVVKLSGPWERGLAWFDLTESKSNCKLTDDVTITFTYMIGEELTATTSSTTIKYLAAPDPPVVTSIVGNDSTPTSLIVNWEKPTTHLWTGNVTGYIITIKKLLWDIPDKVDDPDAVTYELTNLHSCREYTVYVRAKWSGGVGKRGNNTGRTGCQAPDPPVVTSIVGNDSTPTSLIVNWEKPTTHLEWNVTGYIITIKNLLWPISEQVDDPDAVTYELTNLDACREYTVYVRAKWSGGEGKPGSNTGRTGSQAPGKPLIVGVKSRNPWQIKVWWDKPSTNNSCPVDFYKISWTPSNYSMTTDSRHFTISGLNRNTAYNITVEAYCGGKTSSSYVITKTKTLSGGEIAGIVCGCLAGVGALISGIISFILTKRRNLVLTYNDVTLSSIRNQ